MIIVEVTRAANSFGRTHLPEIRRAYDSIAKIVADGQEAGAFRRDIDPTFASMSFYGAIEQLLSGWIFDLIPASDTDFEQAKDSCRGDDLRRPRAAIGKVAAAMDNEIVKRLVWSGLLAASSALASIAAARLAAVALAPALRRGAAGVGRARWPTRPRLRRRTPTTARSPSSSSTSPNAPRSLVREEIELAKAEVSEKVGKILRGSVVGVAAGIFAFLALILVMEGVAWLLNEEVFDGNAWPGFFVEAALFLLIAAGAGFFAYRSVQAGAPPVPEQAIEEAKQIKSTLEGEGERQPRAEGRTEPGHAPGRSAGRDPPRHRPPAPGPRPLGRSPARPRRRADRLAPPGPRAPQPADRRRRRRRLCARRPDDAPAPQASGSAQD